MESKGPVPPAPSMPLFRILSADRWQDLTAIFLVLGVALGIWSFVHRAWELPKQLAQADIQAKIDATGEEPVLYPIFGWAAYRAKVPRGAVLVSINEVPVKGWSVEEIRQGFLGEKGTKVVLKLRLADGEELSVPVNRVTSADAADPKFYAWVLGIGNGLWVLGSLYLTVPVLLNWFIYRKQVEFTTLISLMLVLIGILGIVDRSYTGASSAALSTWWVLAGLVAARFSTLTAMIIFPDWRRPGPWGIAVLSIGLVWSILHILPDSMLNTDMLPRYAYRVIDVSMFLLSYSILQSRNPTSPEQRANLELVKPAALIGILAYSAYYLILDYSGHLSVLNGVYQNEAILLVRLIYYMVLLFIPFSLFRTVPYNRFVINTLVRANLVVISILVFTSIKVLADKLTKSGNHSDVAVGIALISAFEIMKNLRRVAERLMERFFGQVRDSEQSVREVGHILQKAESMSTMFRSTSEYLRDKFGSSNVEVLWHKEHGWFWRGYGENGLDGELSSIEVSDGVLESLQAGEIISASLLGAQRLLVPIERVTASSRTLLGVVAMDTSHSPWGGNNTHDLAYLRSVALQMSLRSEVLSRFKQEGLAQTSSTTALIQLIGAFKERDHQRVLDLVMDAVLGLYRAEEAGVWAVGTGQMVMVAWKASGGTLNTGPGSGGWEGIPAVGLISLRLLTPDGAVFGSLDVRGGAVPAGYNISVERAVQVLASMVLEPQLNNQSEPSVAATDDTEGSPRDA